MPHHLKNLSINELSFVEAPANQDAKVAVLKGGAAVLSDAAHPVRNIVSKTAANPLLDRSPAPQVVAAKADAKPETKGSNSFADAVDQIAKRDGIPRHMAMSRARLAEPELFKSYQGEGPALVAKATPARLQKSAAITTFEARIDQVQARDSCDRITALTKACREFPKERAEYSAALD